MTEHHSITEEPEAGLGRRGLLKRAAAVSVATAWATPVVQSMAAPAFAVGTAHGGCTSCITGGGNKIVGATYNGVLGVLSLGLGQICCQDPGNGNAEPQIEINFHPNDSNGNKDDSSFHFDTLTGLTCTKKSPTPDPPPETKDCANVFTGTASDEEGHSLAFVFEDHGEGNGAVDMVSITITGGGVNLHGAGSLQAGNLQVHAGLAGLQHDCTGC